MRQAWRWLYPGLNIKRWIFLFSIGLMLLILGFTTIVNYQAFGVVEEFLFRVLYEVTGRYNYTLLAAFGGVLVLLGLAVMVFSFRKLMKRILSSIAPEESGRFSENLIDRARRDRGPVVVAIGGGTGLSTLLRGMKKKTSHLSAIVTVADDGGSSGRLREEMNIIAPGDLRNCLVAMADKESLLENIFQHRFGGSGDLAGHSLGNLFLAALMEEYGDTEKALEAASEVLNVRGEVIPASTERIRLRAEMEDGRIVDGESRIPDARGKIKRLHILPETPAATAATVAAIEAADIVTMGPGSLYTSILPNLLVPEIAAALRHSKAVKIYICNAMTQPGETEDFTVSDHVRVLMEHVGPGVVDYVIVNDRKPSAEALERYAAQGSKPVKMDPDELEKLGVKPIRANLITEGIAVSHDPDLLADVLVDVVYALQTDLHPQLLDYYFDRSH